MSGPTRRRSLSRSRVLASRKNRLDQNRLLGLNGVPVGPSPSALPSAPSLPQQKPDQQQGQEQAQTPAAPVAVIPTAVGGGRVAVDSALGRPVKTVGDFLLSEKRMEQKQQQAPQREQQQQPPPPPKKQRKAKKLTKQQGSSVAKAYVPDNDDAAPEPDTEALPQKSTKSRGRSQSGDGGSGARPNDGRTKEATLPKTTVKGSSGVPTAAAVKASTATQGGRVEGKRKAEEMPSSRGEPAELGEVVEGAAAAARLQATAEARARLADGWGANGLDGSPDASA